MELPIAVCGLSDLGKRRPADSDSQEHSNFRLGIDSERDALAELVDASMMEFSDDYAHLSPVQEPKWRVKTLLMKLESDRKNKTDYVSSKFAAKTKEIFSGLPKPKDFITFASHDLPLLFTPAEVQEFALKHRLNKSQTKANLQKN